MLRIAFPSDDGQTISAHLGQALYYAVLTVDDPQSPAPQMERRDKPHHTPGEAHQAPDLNARRAMVGPVADCQVLIAGGMGRPVFDEARARGLQVVLTHETSIAAAFQNYRQGKLVSDPALIHTPL